MSVQRYKVGYYTDEWGMSRKAPCLLRDDNGYAVKFYDYALLKKQRDELLAALTLIASGEAENGSILSSGECQRIAYDAIARVKGGQ